MVDLSAVVVAVAGNAPLVLVVRRSGDVPDALPSGPLEPGHRTLEAGLRARVEADTGQHLGYVEQLYTFGDRDRQAMINPSLAGARALTIGYLALARQETAAAPHAASWHNWYHYFPWEDWRDGRPAIIDRVEDLLLKWASTARRSQRRLREERVSLAFGLRDAAWNEERVLERYELLYEAGMVPEALRDRPRVPSAHRAIRGAASEMAADHRRILATAIGRLRGKIKYRPVVFELLPPTFTLLQLQLTVEALTGRRLHKPNFRRLVESQGLIEDTEKIAIETGGRPARLVRFRREVLLERPAPGVKLPAARQPG